MKIRVRAAIAMSVVSCSTATAQIFAPSPPGNIVQNGTFETWSFSHWSGLMAITGNVNAPNSMIALSGDIYQDLITTPGQRYLLDFYAAADLYLAPTLSLNITLNSQTVLSITTPPYTYIPQIHRSTQMRWVEYSTEFTAASSSTRLEFIALNTDYFGLSAVSVVPIPEPANVMIWIMGSIVVYVVHRKQSLEA